MKRPSYILGEERFFDGTCMIRSISFPDAVFSVLQDYTAECGIQLPASERIEQGSRIMHEMRIIYRSDLDHKFQAVLEVFFDQPQLKELFDSLPN